MLERFSGKAGKPGLPKNQIELVCPLCGAVQQEPRLVLTTFCRKCGEHLRVEKNGRVVASARINPVPSSVYPAMSETDSPAPATAKVAENDATGRVAPESLPEPVEAPAGRGNLAGVRDDDEEVSATGVRRIGRGGPPPPQSVPNRQRDQGGSRQHYFKEIECFDCRSRFKVGRSARSASCPSCGGQVCLDDIDISINSTNSIRTRGDVLITRAGNLQAAEVRCRDLKVFGVLSAAIECSGEFLVRATGTIIGEVHCHRLVIDKGCDIHFMNSIFAEEVEVRGRVLGHIQCSGPVTIGATGLVQGDVKARAVSIEPGGQLDGAMNIVRVPPPKEAKASLPTAPQRLPIPGGDF